jgi:hypothetical protein
MLLAPAMAVMALVTVTALGAFEAPGGDEWKYDVVHRKKGAALSGLLIEQSATEIKFRCITRKPGRHTVSFTVFVPREDVDRLDLLTRAERKVLEDRLKTLAHNRIVLTKHLKALDPKSKKSLPIPDAVGLESVPWPPEPRVKGLGYQSTHFRLVSNARTEVVQLAAIHLEEVYAAYARALPPRRIGARPTTILLARSQADYLKQARARGLTLFNPAFYDLKNNQVVCGSDLEQLRDELGKLREHHKHLTSDILKRRDQLRKIYGTRIPPVLLAPLEKAEKRIAKAEQGNSQALERAQDRLFKRLYHEAFHAYLDNFVYPSREGSLPLWFNEGLAQIFETAIFEVGELRIGHADAERWKAMRDALRRGKLLPVADLLRAAPRNFQVAHADETQVADRYYLASWALTFYLTFDRKLLGTKALDDYVKALYRDTDPQVAFRALVGQPLRQFEKEFLDYLRRLREDGTTGK